MTGLKTTDIDLGQMIDEVLGNRSGSTVRLPVARLGAQLGVEITSVNYQTRALLYADLAWSAGTRGAVFNDATEAWRGIYLKSGASGTGSWTRIGDLPMATLSSAALALKADTVALTTETTARVKQGQAALASFGASNMAASLSGTTWTLTWAGLRGRVGTGNADVADVAALAVPSGSAAVINLDGGSSPYAVTVEIIDSTLRTALEAGAKGALLFNRAGSLSGLLAGQVRTAALEAVQTATAATAASAVSAATAALGTGRGIADLLAAAEVRQLAYRDDQPAEVTITADGYLWKGSATVSVPTDMRILAYDDGQPAFVEAARVDGSGTLRIVRSYSGDGRQLYPAPPSAADLDPEALAVALLSRAEPPLSAAHVLSSAPTTLLGNPVTQIVAERGGVTRLHTRRTDLATTTMIVAAGPMRFYGSNGQSNSVGGGANDLPPGTSPIHHAIPPAPAGCLMFSGGMKLQSGTTHAVGDLDDLVPAFEALNSIGSQGESPGSGALAWAWRHDALTGKPAQARVFRAHGKGATAIAGLTKGSQPYANGLAEAAAAVALAAKYGCQIRCNAVFADHGEADRNTVTAEGYRDTVITWRNDYNTDWGAIFGAGNGQIHMIFTQLAASTTGWAGYPALGQYLAAQDSAYVHIATPNYIFGYTDNVHKLPKDHAHAGEYLMRTARTLEAGGTWTGLRPNAVSRVDNIITITFDVPEGGHIEMLMDRLPAAPDGGFHYSDSTGSATIDRVEITGPATLVITLSNTPTGSNRQISYALDSGAPAITGRAKEWGNLAVRSADKSFVYPGRSLDHYCQIFRTTV